MKNKITTKQIHIRYYALLREERGLTEETVTTSAQTALDLLDEVRTKYNFKLPVNLLKVAINNQFEDWDTELKTGDALVFIPPVAGG